MVQGGPSQPCSLRVFGCDLLVRSRYSGEDGTWEVAARIPQGAMLLALLGVRYGRTVTVDHVVDALWAGGLPHRPEAMWPLLVSRLRARFGPGLITGGRLGYRLNELTRVDLHEAGELVTEAEAWLPGVIR